MHFTYVFMYSPWAAKLPLIERKVRTKEWNAIVQEYIDSGKDSRPAEQIAQASMIGKSLLLSSYALHPLLLFLLFIVFLLGDCGGPLHRRCITCARYESQQIHLLYCTRCKKVRLFPSLFSSLLFSSLSPTNE